ncbi:MFS transporter [Microbacterium faecale]|uniref:MFS transporter n=1 Tax=Microbacterium faecale TaxID=1804630 RepID=A0A916Y977_9MICO|nr:MFS transporter [Microbacterium faecale]GGD35005.1 MFS transporter [Microbacterium faecale]
MSRTSRHLTPTGTIQATRDRRRVAFATVAGTTIEWYDYFTYAACAGLVFGALFFEPAGEGISTILAFGSVGISFLFRPLGAFLAGHFGDKIGRKPILVITLLLMGVATALIGVLPTYAMAGVWAPILLILLRILQGISAGGEWGGAVLMAVEHAPAKRRGFFGSMPQIGVPIGLLLSSGMLQVMNWLFPGDAFLEWGWRIPFLFSIVLIALGYWIRRGVEESPVFTEIAERKEQTSAPVAKLFARFTPLVLLAALVFAGNNAIGYMTTGGYIQNYGTAELGLERGPVLAAVTWSGVSWLVFTLLAGIISDYIGRRTTYIIGYVLLGIAAALTFPVVNIGEVWALTVALLVLTVGLGLTYGPQAAWFTELFPSSVRFSGVSISYAIGSIVGGAFSPMIAAWILEATGDALNIGYYLVGMAVIALVATLLLRNRNGINLRPTQEERQRTGIYIWQKPLDETRR